MDVPRTSPPFRFLSFQLEAYRIDIPRKKIESLKIRLISVACKLIILRPLVSKFFRPIPIEYPSDLYFFHVMYLFITVIYICVCESRKKIESYLARIDRILTH